jgi:hypothetical protein
MSLIEVLVATMNQIDIQKYYDMNIKTDAIFANQAWEFKYQEEVIEQHSVKMITTVSKGVGKNRNNALQLTSAEICLLSDEDMSYMNNYPEILERAFKEIPAADIIVFNIETIGRHVKRRKNNQIKRVNILNFQNYGAARLAFKRESVIRANIWFSLLFGGGCKYSSGEDTLFLRDALRKGLRIYTYPETIGTVDQNDSSWFTGYNKKFFFDKGALLQATFPILKYPFGLVYFPLRFKKQTNLSAKEIRRSILFGIRAFTMGVSYDEWELREKQ